MAAQKFEEIRQLFNYKSKYELPKKSHFTKDALQNVWHEQIEKEPTDLSNRVLVVSKDNVKFYLHHDIMCPLSSVIDAFHQGCARELMGSALDLSCADAVALRQVWQYCYLRCIDAAAFAQHIDAIVLVTDRMNIDLMKQACGIELLRQAKAKELSVEELAQMAANCVLHCDLPEVRSVVVRKLAVRWPEVCSTKPVWQRLKSIARAQENKSETPYDCVTILDEIMEQLPKVMTFVTASKNKVMKPAAPKDTTPAPGAPAAGTEAKRSASVPLNANNPPAEEAKESPAPVEDAPAVDTIEPSVQNTVAEGD